MTSQARRGVQAACNARGGSEEAAQQIGVYPEPPTETDRVSRGGVRGSG